MTLLQKIRNAKTQTLIKLVSILKKKKQLAPWDDKKITLAVAELNRRNDHQKTNNLNHL